MALEASFAARLATVWSAMAGCRLHLRPGANLLGRVLLLSLSDRSVVVLLCVRVRRTAHRAAGAILYDRGQRSLPSGTKPTRHSIDHSLMSGPASRFGRRGAVVPSSCHCPSGGLVGIAGRPNLRDLTCHLAAEPRPTTRRRCIPVNHQSDHLRARSRLNRSRESGCRQRPDSSPARTRRSIRAVRPIAVRLGAGAYPRHPEEPRMPHHPPAGVSAQL